jgi:hypothetical protein
MMLAQDVRAWHVDLCHHFLRGYLGMPVESFAFLHIVCMIPIWGRMPFDREYNYVNKIFKVYA